jgi:excisionase family DNA binding protein
MIPARNTQIPRASRGRDSHGLKESLYVLPPLLTVADVAALLRTSRKAIYAMIERGQLPGVIRINRRVLVDQNVLLDWVSQKSTPHREGERR